MRTAARIGLVLSLLVTGLVASTGQAAPRFRSGQYEQLMLAVDARGSVTGYYREEQGEGVVKACAFYLTGKGQDGEIPIVTWSIQSFPGTLKAQDDGVSLRVDKGREHPGCGLVLLPQIAQGLDFDRVADATWSELRTISTARAYFHSSPDAARVLKTFVVSGDVVGVLTRKGDWLNVEYRGRKTTRGWIPVNTTATLRPPPP